MNVFIEGDKKAAFTSKTAIKKFKNELKKNKQCSNIDLMVLQKKYIHYNYKLELINKSDENITIKVVLNDIIYNSELDIYYTKTFYETTKEAVLFLHSMLNEEDEDS